MEELAFGRNGNNGLSSLSAIQESEMARRITSFDWGATSVGPIEQWSMSLKATVKTMLASRYPMGLLWGEDLIQIYNDAYIGLIGEKHPYALGHSLHETQPESWNALGSMIQNVISTGVSNWISSQLIPLKRAGYLEEAYFNLSYSPLDDDHGVIRGMLCVCSEVTEQVVGERRLKLLREIAARANQAKDVGDVCRTICEALGEDSADVPYAAIYLRDPSTNSLHLRAFSGPKKSKLLFPESTEKQQGDLSRWPFSRVLAGEVLTVSPERNKDDDLDAAENFQYLSARVMPILDTGKSGPSHGVLIAAISPNRALDEDYRSFYDLLDMQISNAIVRAGAYEEEKRRAEALLEIDRAKTAFFSNVSHEFRTPLTLMLGPLEDLLSTQRNKSIEVDRPTIERVYRNSLRLLKLVNSLLDFSRVEAGRLHAHFEPTNLTELTRELASQFESAAFRAGLAFHVDASELPSLVCVDRDMWEKIIFNLLSNAFKFTFQGEIRVTLREIGDEVELAVSDTGTGIPQSELPKIFDRFYRVEGAKSRTHEGSGIGLSLVRELARLHGGTVHVESRYGHGTTFRVCIPFRSSSLPMNPTEEGRSGNPTSARVQPFLDETAVWEAPVPSVAEGAGYVLVVDDNEGMRSYVSSLLAHYYEVKTARNGREALEIVDKGMPILILSDVMMPEMDGFALLSAIRSKESTKRLPVILLSARAGDEAIVEGLGAGADDYLSKPFSAKELLARVSNQISMVALRQDLETEKRATRMRDEFLSIASHELKTPITSLKIQIQVLARQIRKEDPQIHDLEYLGTIMEGADRQLLRVNRLIDDMLDVSRISNGRLRLEFEECDLSELVREVCGRFNPQLTMNRIKIETDIRLGIRIQADCARIEQVVTNLLSNALKYGNGNPIAICVSQQNGFSEITVVDHGIGIAREDLSRIFERFERVTSRNNVNGLGLGLYITRKIVEGHGGEISAESEIGKGTTFRVRLPLVQVSR